MSNYIKDTANKMADLFKTENGEVTSQSYVDLHNAFGDVSEVLRAAVMIEFMEELDNRGVVYSLSDFQRD